MEVVEGVEEEAEEEEGGEEETVFRVAGGTLGPNQQVVVVEGGARTSHNRCRATTISQLLLSLEHHRHSLRVLVSKDTSNRTMIISNKEDNTMGNSIKGLEAISKEAGAIKGVAVLSKGVEAIIKAGVVVEGEQAVGVGEAGDNDL